MKRHGRSYTPEYRTYIKAKVRCQNQTVREYKNYGGRGIEFRFTCFEEFFAEVGLKPTPKHSIDRKDVNGHYEKGNVQWATRRSQDRNKRFNHRVTFNGETKTVVEWAEIKNLLSNTLTYRLSRNWCVECALNNPVQIGCPHRKRLRRIRRVKGINLPAKDGCGIDGKYFEKKGKGENYE